ncbi:hypothetical protein PR048_029130 [Dryococelus australis]|uniref:Uncharacterized protein n=1 Tax=Dryococelus australis TaxID=614101 RepID=A0ABQ9GFA3_9NEOP|nr:hypothetical protein PR048_029130 [Dryococelus australis]
MKAETFYRDLKEKTELSKEDEEVEVLTFYFQQSLPLPKVPSGDASIGVSFGPITVVYILVKLAALTSICMMKQLLENQQMRIANVQPISVLYDSSLPVKAAKYKDVMHLVTNFVPPNEAGFYHPLKCMTAGDDIDAYMSHTDDDDQAGKLYH